MKTLLQAIKTVGRVGYALMSWVLVALVFMQVYHAGVAVLVSPGDWGGHRSVGAMIGLAVMLLAIMSLVGWMPFRFFLFSLGLYGLYMTQYLLIYLPGNVNLPALSALHPVNALVILLTALHTARQSWQLVTANWPAGVSPRRVALYGVTAACVLGTAALGLQPGDWLQAGADGGAPASLADATEASVPGQYRTMQNPVADDRTGAVAAGQQIAQQRCVSCHAADFKGKQLGSVRSADLTNSGAARSEQFLMWAISEGSQRGMPPWESGLSEEERWQLVTYIQSLGQQ